MKQVAKYIDVARDFHSLPSGRIIGDNVYSAEAMYEYILKYLEDKVVVLLDFRNVLGAGSSFLQELAKLVSKDGYAKQVVVESSDDTIPSKYYRYLEECEL